MGSFNVGCGLSNLSINEGDEVGFVILAENFGIVNHEKYQIRNPGEPYILNSDLLPVFPPIYGVYDDYGNITDIKKSKTTDLLETIFLKPYDAVIGCLTRGGGAYDTYGSIYGTYIEPNSIFTSYSSTQDEKMASLGYEVTENEDTPSSYSYGNFSLRASAEYVYSLFDHDKDTMVAGPVVAHSIENILNLFSRYTGIYPGFAEEFHAPINNLERYSGMFFLKEIFDGMAEHFEQTQDEQEELYPSFLGNFNETWDDFIATFNYDHIPTTGVYGSFSATSMDKYRQGEKTRPFASSWDLKTNEFLKRLTAFPTKFYDHLRFYENDYSFRSIRTLSFILTAVNRTFTPSVSGEQFGNDEANQKLNNLSDAILKNRAEERG